ncbi:MAG: glycosyltransferase [Methylobacter sp.]|uniref:glycosyltransferase n=1 Tax=Methylobacter sp. TaxID=2051955 RepID=UPI002589E6D9|nr:glycosyltransferase [Methylobacter sp.]MCL7420750.1 glycosyltransferase [Methylobacter sp.]
MRIVIDLQAAQSTGSRNRGIGRYSLSLALAMAHNRGEHEIFIALNGLFPDSIEPIREAFAGLLPKDNIRVWHAVGPVADLNATNDGRRRSAELVREAFLASLRPDIVHISSLFEGLGDDAVTSVGIMARNIPTAVTLYDLIPYIHRKPYLENPAVESWYLGKLNYLRRADLWLAISESSRQEGIDFLGLPDEWSINISTDADAHFQPLRLSAEDEQELRQKYRLTRPFVMYTGGIDHRKNIEGLIRAFSRLPDDLRKTHQLAIVCSIQMENRRMLEQLASQHGLSKDDIVLTGFVSEDDLLALYNLCTLFIFPSKHEGFGLPALEAMRCEAPVIGANTSSLPEVIGWEEALFDPHSEEAIAAAIGRALSDIKFRAELVHRGKAQAQRFSWNDSAKRAIAAMEQLHAERQVLHQLPNTSERRPKLAYVSPLPPEKSGIADYSAELLPELARLYEIDVIIAQESISDPWIRANCAIRSEQWFVEHADHYERVLYHFGNSDFHQHMFDLLKKIPGVVVLHDFFLSGIVAHMDFLGLSSGRWPRELYHSHGYAALRDRFHAKNTANIVWKYPCSLGVIQDSLGIIVHSVNSLRLVEQWYGADLSDWNVIPHMRDPRVRCNRNEARRALGFESQDFLVCAFGILGPHKLSHRLLQVWLRSDMAQNVNCHLIFVGENHSGDYGRELLTAIQRSKVEKNIRITGWADMDVFRQYLAAADVGVQLRTHSRGETSGTVLDCMNYGLPVIVNANGSMADLDKSAVWMLPDEFTDEQLIEALESLRQDTTLRSRLGLAGRDVILRDHNPRVCANRYAQTIEHFYRSAASDLQALPAAIANLDSVELTEKDLIQLSNAIAHSFPPRNKTRQLLVDVSELVQRDSKSGIQRVVRGILLEWLLNPPQGLRIEPVYATTDEPGYRYARRFTLAFLNCPNDLLEDELIEYSTDDLFLGLDLQFEIVLAQQDTYQQMRRQGVCVKFVIYDLLPIQLPETCAKGVPEQFMKWLTAVTKSDGAVCISRAVAGELSNWMQNNVPEYQARFAIDWFHLGADVKNSLPSSGLPNNSDIVLRAIKERPSFLMVGTIEPRKGHAQVLETFEQLWLAGHDVNLVIVGKQGWSVEMLIARLKTHPEFNKRLFWLMAISDEYLERIYAASACLIVASYGEGFGLPLAEAAQHKLPIIAREIPVFAEVAGPHAYYFSGKKPSDLADAITNWLVLYKDKKHPTSENMPWITWKQSAEQLMSKIL